MITYNWNCKTVDCYVETEGESDVVYNVHWIVTGVSDTLDPEGNAYTSQNIGTQALNIEDITDFIPFDQLTNEEIVAWTKTAMGEEKVTSIEERIAAAIELLITPVSVTLVVGE
tara:strand:+ start:3914 stop:4255 length:342 start_codon:yes stop_codon:yes gene_type:complete